MITKRLPWLAFFPEPGDRRGLVAHILIIIPICSFYFVCLMSAFAALFFAGRQRSLSVGLFVMLWGAGTLISWIKAINDIVRRKRVLRQGAVTYVRLRFRPSALVVDGNRGHQSIPWREVSQVQSQGDRITICDADGGYAVESEKISFTGSSLSLGGGLASFETMVRDINVLKESSQSDLQLLLGVRRRFGRSFSLLIYGR